MRVAGTSLRPLEIWRRDVSLRDAENFSSSLLTTVVRAGAGAKVGPLGERPAQPVVLYEMERCPFSRLVREALSELDLDAQIKPCPPGESLHRAQLTNVRGKAEVPFLIDSDRGRAVGGAVEIVRYLYETYGQGLPPRALRGGPTAMLSSRLATRLRGGEQHYEEPSRRPEQPLELWNYEGSPYCRMVRERLGALALPYLSHNLARNSPRRPAFEARFGRLQFPRLSDPNTGAALFETSQILGYLDAAYAGVPVPVGLYGPSAPIHA